MYSVPFLTPSTYLFSLLPFFYFFDSPICLVSGEYSMLNESRKFLVFGIQQFGEGDLWLLDDSLFVKGYCGVSSTFLGVSLDYASKKGLFVEGISKRTRRKLQTNSKESRLNLLFALAYFIRLLLFQFHNGAKREEWRCSLCFSL